MVHSLSPAAKEGVDDDFGDGLMTRVQLPYSLPKYMVAFKIPSCSELKANLTFILTFAQQQLVR